MDASPSVFDEFLTLSSSTHYRSKVNDPRACRTPVWLVAYSRRIAAPPASVPALSMHSHRSGQHRVRNSIRKFNIDAILDAKPWLALERRDSLTVSGCTSSVVGRFRRSPSDAVDSVTQQSPSCTSLRMFLFSPMFAVYKLPDLITYR